MLLLLDADIGFLGFVEKRINASLVAALVWLLSLHLWLRLLWLQLLRLPSLL